MTDCKSVKYSENIEFILDLIDDYLDVKEAVEWDEMKGEDHDKQNL
jgi:hypothetical protein